MELLIKVLPFLFKLSPNGKHYWFFRNWIKITLNGHDVAYSFWLRKTFILESNFSYELKEKESYYKEKIGILEDKIKISDNVIETKEWYQLEHEEAYNKLSNSYKELSSNRENIIVEMGKKEGKIKELKEKLASMKVSKNDVMNFLKKEISEKEKVIGDLLELVNNERITISNERLKIEESHSNNIEKIVKQLEMLDKDFVDVAKAMRIYRQNKDRPVKGFRIKT